MDKKKIAIVLAVLGLGLGAYWLFFRKKKSAAKVNEQGYIKDSFATRANYSDVKSEENIQTVELDTVDEEFALKRQEYLQVTGKSAPKSYTLKQLQDGIDDYLKRQNLIQQYVSLSGDDDLSQEMIMNVSELEAHILLAQQEKSDRDTKDELIRRWVSVTDDSNTADEAAMTVQALTAKVVTEENNYNKLLTEIVQEFGGTKDTIRAQYNTIAELKSYQSSKRAEQAAKQAAELAKKQAAWNSQVESIRAKAVTMGDVSRNQAKAGNKKKIMEHCNWFSGLSKPLQYAAMEIAGWDILDGKWGWEKDNVLFTWEQRDAIALAYSNALSVRNKKLDKYGNLS